MISNRKSQGEAAASGPPVKAGRRASGLRDLSPEAARLAIMLQSLELARSAPAAGEVETATAASRRLRAARIASVSRVEGAVSFRDGIGRQLGRAETPTLERLLMGDVVLARVDVPEDGVVQVQRVVRGDGGVSRLRAAGVPAALIFTAEAFLRDVEAARIGKLTASYGEGLGGGCSAEPERMLMAMQRLLKAQRDLNAMDRMVLWGALVFGLSFHDVGHATDGERTAVKKRLIERGQLRLEVALERIKPAYDARGA